jgi:CHAT domain-containing protein
MYDGEERLGLVTGLLSAGVQSVISSLWPIADTDAYAFFSLFYPKLKQGMPKIDAFHETILTLMERDDKQEFYYWAAFVLQGNPF